MKIALSAVKEILRIEDVEGYIEIHGVPDDEYDSEAEDITDLLNDMEEDEFTEENILAVVSVVWAEMFNLDKEDTDKRMPALRRVAQSLHSLIGDGR